jgi:signal transduction histidine kinase
VFLFRSLRRRLVLLQGVALLMMLALAWIGWSGLLSHREAISDLDFLLYKSPDRDQLSRAMTRVSECLFEGLDLRQAAAVDAQEKLLTSRLSEARDALFGFRRKLENLGHEEDLAPLQKAQILSRLDGVYGELQRVARETGGLRSAAAGDDSQAVDQIRYSAAAAVTRIQKSLDTLPAWQTHSRVERSLEKEQQRSARLLRWLTIVAGLVALMFVCVLYFSLKWISGPVREIANGCTRIADGDTRYRLPATRCKMTEYEQLVEGVNLVAERFQQAEDDLNQKVRDRSEQLLRSQRLAGVGFLAAGVAHEVNNPLSAISCAADALECRLYDLCDDRDAPTVQSALERIAMIRRESRRCGEITTRLLDFSRSDRSGNGVEDLTSLVREVLQIVQHLGRFSDRPVIFECDRPVSAEVSASQIKQVVLNLVVNALQASPPESPVTIRLVEQVDTVVLSISDLGCGMDAETREHIFDPFFSTKGVGQGTGLGLSITHRIVEDHEGTITPLSEGPGRGSTFVVRLPRRRSSRSAA